MADGERLLRATRDRDAAAVRALLARGNVDVNWREPRSKVSPLCAAAQSGLSQIAEMLLKANADPNVTDSRGWTPLHRAAGSIAFVQVVELLLEGGADPNAVTGRMRFSAEQVRSMMRPITWTDKGATPLHLASSAKRGNARIVDLLLQANANPNAVTQAGGFPLHFAAEKGHTQIVELLLLANADPNVATQSGLTPLCYAAHKPHVEIIEMLVNANADVNIIEDGATLLYRAASKGHTRVVKALLKGNADPNLASRKDKFPLVIASRSGYLPVIELLLKANADPNVTTTLQRSPLHFACEYHRNEITHLLLLAGSHLHAKDSEHFEPLHLCIKRNQYTKWTLDTLQELVSFGAAWDAKCDELVDANEAPEAQALRVCAQVWAQERADGLPFTKVGPDVIKRGPEHTQTYIDELKDSKETKYRRKICVVGPSKAGKTSLAKSLTAREPCLVHPDDRTIGVDQILLRFGVESGDRSLIHEVTFWDFAGQDEYQVAHSLFFSARTLYLVCVDLESFLAAYMQADLMGNSKIQSEQLMNEFVERDILRWVRLIFSQQPDAEFVFIAAKDDLLAEFPAFTKEVKAFVAKKLEQVEGIVDEMKRELADEVSNGGRAADTLTIHAYQTRVEKRHTTSCDEESLRYKCMSGDSVERPQVVVDNASKTMTNLQAKFAWGRRAYHQLVSSVKSRTRTNEMPTNEPPATHSTHINRVKRESLLYVSCSDVASVEQARREVIALIVRSDRSFEMPESYTSVLDAVVERRQAAANATSDARVTQMFAPVDPLVKELMIGMEKQDKTLCRTILRTLHDLGDVLWYETLGIELFQHTVILDPLLLIDFVRQVINHQHKVEKLAHGELKGLPFWVSLTSEAQFLAIKQVLRTFHLVHPSDGAMKWNSDLIVPAFWRSKTPASWLFGYEDVRLAAGFRANDPNQPEEQVRVHWQYHFAHEFPDALFDHLVVATYSPYMDRDAGPDWIAYAVDGVYACRAMVTRDTKTVHRVLQLEAVLATQAGETHVEELWEAFECLSEGIVKVLKRYPGLVVTSVALDHQSHMHDLESLFAFPLKVRSRRWMPRVKSWTSYIQASGFAGNATE